MLPVLAHKSENDMHYLHGHNLVGDMPLHFFRQGRHIIPCPLHLFLFKFHIWKGFKNKNVCHVLCKELFMLDGRPHIARLMLKQSLVSLILLVY